MRSHNEELKRARDEKRWFFSHVICLQLKYEIISQTYEVSREAINHEWGKGVWEAANVKTDEGTLLKATNNTPRINHRFCDDPS